MADSTPLLPHSDSADSETPRLDTLLPSLDEMIEKCLGSFGWAQFLQAILVSLAWLFDGQQTFITIFTDVEPSWHCTELGNGTCNSDSTICQLSKAAWAWDKPMHTSIVSEWALQCASSIITGLPASSFFMGSLLGGFALSTLADSSIGRKNMLFLSSLTMSLASLLTVFSTNVWIYSALRFVSGFGRASIGACALVLSTEIVGKRWRSQVGIVGFMSFTLGFLSLPAIAYLTRGSSWRILYLWTSIPSIFYCILLHFLVRESPRWLFMQGRKEEAVATLKKMAPTTNQNSINLCLSGMLVKQETLKVDLHSSIKMLLEKKWALQRLLAVMVIGFGIGMVYYGMPLGLGNLAFNLYLSVTFNALSELPSFVVTFFFIGRWNRRCSLLVFNILSGVCSIMCAVLGDGWKGLQMGLELSSFFCACTAFAVLLIYTLELFPTCVRNSATSMVRQALVFSGVFSPFLIASGRKNAFLSYGVFGLVIVCCGLFVICLPETKGETLCDTMDEQENKESAASNTVNCV